MDAELWRRVEEAFLACEALPAAERAAFLNRLAGENPEVCREVRSLLAASADATGRVDAVVADAVTALAESQEPETVGPYRILRRIGGGGLSTVYLAERLDGEYEVQVAVKVIKPGMATEEIQRRLRQERQILANLQHPHIAQLLDGGTSADGQSYFVLERIHGEPIDTYCDRHRLTIDERLRLFRTVCDAVDHAHRNLVVHRDIKPSNILVTDEGVPKLLDFGIAKLLSDDRGAGTELRTTTGLRLMTPEYASPEQIRGLTLSTATDVYSLGVLLYHLLTGVAPYRIEGRGLREVERVVCETDPPPPSHAATRDGGDPADDAATRAAHRGATPARLRRRLAGDLDKIVLMALRKEPSRRYASVGHLADDLARHQASQPVVARRDTWAYRTVKFVRRNRLAVLATAALFVALLAGIVATTRATLRAERHLAEARTVSDFLVDLFEVADPEEAQGRQISARELLDEGARKIERDLRAEPEVRSALMGTMGNVYRNLGSYETARTMLEEVVEERRRRLGEEHPDTLVALRDLAEVMYRQGQYEPAQELASEVLAAQRRRLGETHREVAATLYLEARLAKRQGDELRAKDLYRRSLAMRNELLGAEHPESLESLNGLAGILYRLHDLEGAESLFRRAVELRRRGLGETHPDVAESLNNLAVILHARGELEEAEATLRSVVELRRRLFGEEDPRVALSCNNLAQVLLSQGRDEEASEWMEEALDLSRRSLGPEHPQVADLLNNLALALEKAGRGDEAAAHFREALALRRKLLGDDHPDVAQTLFALAESHRRGGRNEEALALLGESLRILRNALPAGDPRLAYPLVLKGATLAESGSCAPALPPLREAIQLSEKHPELARELDEARRALARCSPAAVGG